METIELGNITLYFSKGKYRIISPIASPKIYDSYGWFYPGGKNCPVWLKYQGKWGAIDHEARPLVPFMYDFVEPFGNEEQEGLLYNWVELNGKNGLVSYDNVQYWED